MYDPRIMKRLRGLDVLLDQFANEKNCPICDGTGKNLDTKHKCNVCDGTGVNPRALETV